MENLTNTLTELETIVVAALKQGDDFEEMPTECLGNLIDSTQLSPKVLRGVISSLIQKDLVMTGEFPNGMVAYHYCGE